MDPITLAIISFVLSFIVAKKSGLSTTASLATAAGVGGLTYYGAKRYQDSQNKGSLDLTGQSGEPAEGEEGLGTIIGDVTGGFSDFIRNNPLLSIGAAGAAGSMLGDNKWLLYGALGLGAFLILK